MLLHDVKNEDGIRLFFLDVWESYVKVSKHHTRFHILTQLSGLLHVQLARQVYIIGLALTSRYC